MARARAARSSSWVAAYAPRRASTSWRSRPRPCSARSRWASASRSAASRTRSSSGPRRRPRRPGNLWIAGLVLVGIALSLALTVAARRIFAGYGYANIQARHRTAVTHQYLRLPMSWHRAHPAGQLLSNANSDVEAATGSSTRCPSPSASS
ncbi:ABC transporter transmembrane domain-containing protein [Oerskovia sp. M15]